LWCWVCRIYTVWTGCTECYAACGFAEFHNVCVYQCGGSKWGWGLEGSGRPLASRNLGWRCGIPRVSKFASGNIIYFVACGLCWGELLSMISWNRGLFCTFVVCSGMSVPC
jgi:hypothetical protein